MTMTTAGPACHRAAAYSSTLILVFSAFALFGLLFGVWQVVLPDLQPDDSKATMHQVRQVRTVLLKYQLEGQA